MPRSPESASTGSPGMRRISEKTSSVMPRKVGTTRPRRLRTKASTPWTASGLLVRHVHLVEEVVRGGVHLVARHFLSDRIEAHRVGDRDPWRFVVRDLLRLGVEAGAVGLARRELGVLDELLEAVVAPARDVAAALDRGAAEQRHEEVVGVAVVARPAEHHRVLLAGLAALPVLAPLVGDELGANGDLLPVLL